MEPEPRKRIRRLWMSKLTSIGAVPDGDNPPAAIVLWKSRKAAREFGEEQREDMADRGVAMPDGSFPIPDKDALRRAIASFGRAKNPAAVRAHIVRRARALGASDMLPEDWQQKGVDGVTDDITEDKVEEAVETVAPEAEPAEDEVAKRVADAEAEIVKAREERDQAVAALAAEVQKRRQGEYLVKARTLEGLLGPADETAPLLDRLEAADPDAYTELEKRLTAALARVSLTKEIGSADGQIDPITRRDAWVRKFLTDHPEQTEATARALFWKANPEAVDESRKEM